MLLNPTTGSSPSDGNSIKSSALLCTLFRGDLGDLGVLERSNGAFQGLIAPFLVEDYGRTTPLVCNPASARRVPPDSITSRFTRLPNILKHDLRDGVRSLGLYFHEVSAFLRSLLS